MNTVLGIVKNKKKLYLCWKIVESDTRFSTLGFFHESVSPKPPSIPMGPFKIRGDIRE
jgi:hypothetical protein